jgi:asparagine synthase (glutamine-hydrolysing)
MSVQGGIWNFDGEPVDRKLLEDLSRSLRAQGPDGDFRYTEQSFAMFYRPFHTTAESRHEQQPYVSPRGAMLTWDGRLDDREALVAELSSDLKPLPTDIDIVAAAFDRWETDCFRHLVGDWAVSIWQQQRRELIFAADYMAVRHIFYYLKNDQIWWSTDLSPLILLSGDKFHIDDNYIAGYLAHDPEAHLSPYREIRQVPPGQVIRVRNSRTLVERHWRLNPKCRIRYKTDSEYEDHFRHIFRQSIRRRLRSDSPVLAELSGGLDSSSIVCVADDILTKEGAETPRLDTISYYDNTEPQGDDWIYFQKVEQKRGRVGTHIDASVSCGTPASWQSLEFEPLPGRLGSGRQLEAQRAAFVLYGGFRAVLSGIGGDEFLGGIPDPSAQLADLIIRFKPVDLMRQLIAWSLVKRRPWIHLLGQAFVELLPVSLAQHLDKHADVEPWIEKQFAARSRLAMRQLGLTETLGAWLPTRRACIGGLLQMANRLAKCKRPRSALEENRYPYLDQDLIEFILSIPADQMLRPGERRSLMRRALAGIVPDEILARKTKQFGVRTPILFLQRNLEHLERAFTLPLSARLGYVNEKRFVEQLRTMSSDKRINIVRILKTISLEFWLRDLDSRHLIELATLQPPTITALSLEAST